MPLPEPRDAEAVGECRKNDQGGQVRVEDQTQIGRGRGHKTNIERSRGDAGQQPSSNRKDGTEYNRNKRIAMRETGHL